MATVPSWWSSQYDMSRLMQGGLTPDQMQALTKYLSHYPKEAPSDVPIGPTGIPIRQGLGIRQDLQNRNMTPAGYREPVKLGGGVQGVNPYANMLAPTAPVSSGQPVDPSQPIDPMRNVIFDLTGQAQPNVAAQQQQVPNTTLGLGGYGVLPQSGYSAVRRGLLGR